NSRTILKAHLRIKNNHEGFKLLNPTLENLCRSLTKETFIHLENTGIYSFTLFRFLCSKRYMAHTYNPLLIKEFAKLTSLRKTKTDKQNALTIAYKSFLDRIDSPLKVDSAIEELKRLTQHRSRMGQYQSDL